MLQCNNQLRIHRQVIKARPGVELLLPPAPVSDHRHRGLQDMAVQSIIVGLIVGAIAGWLAGKVVRGGGFGLLGDIAVGITGSVIAGFLFPYFHISLGTGFIRAVIDAFSAR
jgi:uncharacterized membrane protein YeaQ/YmgE (transglycosylase-associated protein family)